MIKSQTLSLKEGATAPGLAACYMHLPATKISLIQIKFIFPKDKNVLQPMHNSVRDGFFADPEQPNQMGKASNLNNANSR